MTYALPRRMFMLFAAFLLAAAVVFGLSAVNSPARANSQALTVVYNDTSNATIGVLFHTNWGTWVTLNIGPHGWQGEVPGNTSYEPRALDLGAGWCLGYHYKIAGQAAGSTYYACGGSTGGQQSIDLGQAWTTNYNVHVTSVWYRGY